MYSRATKIIAPILLAMVASISSGAAPIHHQALVAHAGSLNPAITTPSKAAVVETEVVYAPTPVIASESPSQPATGSDGLVGSLGYANPFGNCVLEVPAAIRPNGNPITWAVTTQTPYIGGVALFNFNHVGMITGIWSNGDLEIRHQNWHGGNQHRFPRSAFRGFR